MNPTRNIFQIDINMKEQHCIKQCQKVLNDEHITWCEYLNNPNDFKYYHILNGDLNEKLETYNQIKSNNRRREVTL